MTDHELLELAAKAAGCTHVAAGRVCGIVGKNQYSGGLLCDNDLYWNPLRDDGDALRLAVKLGLTVEILNRRMEPHTSCDGKEEEHRSDPCAATRRAIVRAAAEIGRNMK